MGDEPKQTAPDDSGTSDDNNKKATLFNELDSLRHTLNSGPEFQQDIPTLNDPVAPPLEQCDLFRDSDGLIHDPDLDIPILTDTLEQPDSPQASAPSPNSPAVEPSGPDTSCPDTSTIAHEEPQQCQQQALQDEEHSEEEVSDVARLQQETDSSVQELEQVLDELVAEQLPKLEQQLREKLRRELESK